MAKLRLCLREVRIAKGMTQAALARKANVRTATVNRIEMHHVTAIDLDVLDKLARALGVVPWRLLTREPRP